MRRRGGGKRALHLQGVEDIRYRYLQQSWTNVINSPVNDVFEGIAAEASRLATKDRRSTFREMQTALRLLLQPRIAISEETKTISEYTNSK